MAAGSTQKGRAAKARIVDEAIALLAQHLWAEVSIKDIAKAAGSKQGLVTYYFPSKHQLLVEVVEAHLRGSLSSFGFGDPSGRTEDWLRLHTHVLVECSRDEVLGRLLCNHMATVATNFGVAHLKEMYGQMFLELFCARHPDQVWLKVETQAGVG